MSKNKLNEHPLHIRITRRMIIDQALWFAREFASIINYIIAKKGDVPKPIYVGSAFPINYGIKVHKFDFKMPWEEM